VPRTIESALIGLGLAGCSAVSPLASPPPVVLEQATAVASTALVIDELAAASAETPAPFNLSTPAIVIEHFNPGEAPTGTPSGVLLPPAQLTVFRPGPSSQVVSPFQVFGRGGPSFNERVTIRLYGENGRLISERVTYLLVFPGRAGNFVAQVEFDTTYVAEAARLEVSTQDPRYGRLAQLASVDLVLLSAGTPRVHPQLEGPEKLAILSPQEGALIQGGVVQVRGAGWAASDQPLTIELLDRNGSRLASQPIWLDAPRIGQAGSFAVDLAYQVPFSQYGRLALYEQSAGIPGTLHYSSVEIWLQP
jgi:hypothetical protein